MGLGSGSRSWLAAGGPGDPRVWGEVDVKFPPSTPPFFGGDVPSADVNSPGGGGGSVNGAGGWG